MSEIEKPKFKIVKKSTPPFKIIAPKKQHVEDILNYMEAGLTKKRFAPDNYHWGNGKIDYRFGQEWNCGGLDGVDDIFYLAGEVKEYIDLEDRFYDTLLRLNPCLEGICADTREKRRGVLRGVGSRLHYNDIKYFIEDVNCDATNDNLINKLRWRLALTAYSLRNPSKEKNEAKIKQGLGGDIEFVLSPETSNRVIFNDFYNL